MSEFESSIESEESEQTPKEYLEAMREVGGGIFSEDDIEGLQHLGLVDIEDFCGAVYATVLDAGVDGLDPDQVVAELYEKLTA